MPVLPTTAYSQAEDALTLAWGADGRRGLAGRGADRHRKSDQSECPSGADDWAATKTLRTPKGDRIPVDSQEIVTSAAPWVMASAWQSCARPSRLRRASS
jgi:hypothetical protein